MAEGGGVGVDWRVRLRLVEPVPMIPLMPRRGPGGSDVEQRLKATDDGINVSAN